MFSQRRIQSPIDFRQFDLHQLYAQIDAGELPPEEIIRWLELLNAYWKFDHQGDLKRPHALMTAGGHSDGFVDSWQLLSFPKISMGIAYLHCKLLREAHGITGVDWVIGSPYADIDYSADVAFHLNARHGFTEKGPDGKGKIWSRLAIKPGETVLLIEELSTTMKTAEEQRAALHTTTGEPVNFIEVLGVFFNRSGMRTFGDWPIVSVVERDMTNYTPQNCPLCPAGSEAIRPKGDNWPLLTGQA